jgi:hypothetical protein
MLRLAVTSGLMAGLLLSAHAYLKSTPASSLPDSFPTVILWAWEAPQDLRFLNPADNTAIAFLDRTVFLHPQGVRSVPRLQPLRYWPGLHRIAVARMESLQKQLPPPREAATAVAQTALVHDRISALQIDFDARQSERGWYVSFLRELRRQVSATIPITITALESWCEERRRPWIDTSLPIADATPMLFRMGTDEDRTPIRFPVSMCNASAGVSTDEMPERIPRAARRIYIFHPGSWTLTAYRKAMQQVSQWRSMQ